MSRFRIADDAFDGYPALRISDGRHGTECRIALRGATLLSFRIPGPGGVFDVVDGYADGDQLATLKGSRSALMLPFTNRVADGGYAFDGRTLALPERRPDGNAMHGLVRDADWTAVDRSLDEGWVLLRTDRLSGDVEGYPFSLECFARFRLDGNTLELGLSAANTGSSPAPLGMGWHPYLRAPRGELAGCWLQLPARQWIATDGRLLPLPGDRAYVDLAGGALDFRGGAPLDGVTLDTCFAGLAPDADGWTRSVFTDPDAGYRATVAQRGGVVHVFTPRADGEGRRRSLAVEPTEVIPDAFNRPDCIEAVRLPPGEARTFVSLVQAGFHAR